jgi:hypothetical protein
MAHPLSMAAACTIGALAAFLATDSFSQEEPAPPACPPGCKGDKGDPGPAGDVGPKGDKGDAGAPGENNVQLIKQRCQGGGRVECTVRCPDGFVVLSSPEPAWQPGGASTHARFRRLKPGTEVAVYCIKILSP